MPMLNFNKNVPKSSFFNKKRRTVVFIFNKKLLITQLHPLQYRFIRLLPREAC